MKQTVQMVSVISAALVTTTPASGGEVIEILDQIGNGNALSAASSSSQFSNTTPGAAGVTIDNFTISVGDGEAMRITQIDAVVAQLQNVISYGMVESWTVQIYSSPKAAGTSGVGDMHSQTFVNPTSFDQGFGFATDALAGFDVDVILGSGEYWLGIVMNNGKNNGTVGIRHSTLSSNGDAELWLSPSGNMVTFGLGAAYRITGEVVIPGPGGIVLIGPALMYPGPKRRRSGLTSGEAAPRTADPLPIADHSRLWRASAKRILLLGFLKKPSRSKEVLKCGMSMRSRRFPPCWHWVRH